MTETSKPLAVLLDFDGTITQADIGDLIIQEFGRDGWQAASAAYDRGELSLRELWAVEISHLREEDHERMRQAAADGAVIRPGFRELLDHCRTKEIPVEIASSGIRFYIEAVLEKAGVSGVNIASPDASYDEQGNGLVTFKDGLFDCGMTAMCKCERVWRQRRLGREILFVGDGASDHCAALQADHVMARASLARYCEREVRKFTPFEDFFQVREMVEGLSK